MPQRPIPAEADIVRFRKNFNDLLNNYQQPKDLERFRSTPDNMPHIFAPGDWIRVSINGMEKLPPPILDKVIKMINEFESGKFQ